MTLNTTLHALTALDERTPKIYECLDCLAEFEEDETFMREERVTSEFWGAIDTTSQWYRCCPDCGSDEIDMVEVDDE